MMTVARKADQASNPTNDGGGPAQADWLLDWITVWQSEWAALASDREAQEGWQAMIRLWANAARDMSPMATALFGRAAHDGSAGRTGPAAPPRPTSPDAAPDARDAEIERLARRVAELEQQLAAAPKPRARPRARPRGT